MLVIALNPTNPYGYYILLRWVLCPLFAYLAIQTLGKGKDGWVWALAITAAVYNPIIRLHLTREIWFVVNVLTIIIAAMSIGTLKEVAAQEATDSREK